MAVTSASRPRASTTHHRMGIVSSTDVPPHPGRTQGDVSCQSTPLSSIVYSPWGMYQMESMPWGYQDSSRTLLPSTSRMMP